MFRKQNMVSTGLGYSSPLQGSMQSRMEPPGLVRGSNACSSDGDYYRTTKDLLQTILSNNENEVKFNRM